MKRLAIALGISGALFGTARTQNYPWCLQSGAFLGFVVIPRNGPVSNLSAYRHHEVAHCDGWSHSHSGAANSEGDSDLGNDYRMR
jgi:hypothetical protein